MNTAWTFSGSLTGLLEHITVPFSEFPQHLVCTFCCSFNCFIYMSLKQDCLFLREETGSYMVSFPLLCWVHSRCWINICCLSKWMLPAPQSGQNLLGLSSILAEAELKSFLLIVIAPYLESKITQIKIIVMFSLWIRKTRPWRFKWSFFFLITARK